VKVLAWILFKNNGLASIAHESLQLPFRRPPFHRSEGHRSIVPSFHRSIVPSFHRSTVPSVHRSIVPSFHRSTVPSFHRSIVPSFQGSRIKDQGSGQKLLREKIAAHGAIFQGKKKAVI
jgi:hypothetical protein